MQHAADKTLKNTFQKRDKLKSSLEIEDIYRKNKFVVSYPLKCYYSFSEKAENKNVVRAAFAVPKKGFKLAVDRNTLKRRMREAYRLNYKKIFESFLEQNDKQLGLFFIYVGKEMMDFEMIEKSLCKSASSVSSVCFR
jgi:ribonuclease P protein component